MSHRRRTASVLGLLLAATPLSVLPAAPAAAAAGCLRDVAAIPLVQAGCDDTTPPETAIGATAPRVNAAGWTNKAAIRVGFLGSHPDGDADPIGFACSFGLDAQAPTETDWADCPADGVFRGLGDTVSQPYVLWVRAVDTADAAIAWQDGNPLNGFADEPAGDVDATPARLTFGVDTVAPDSFVSDAPKDPITPQRPVVPDAEVRLQLAASEPTGFVCTLDGASVPCAAGPNRWRRLAPGDHTLQVQARDAAGNLDPSPATTHVTVPTDLRAVRKKERAGWQRIADRDHLGGGYLVPTRKGATLRVKTAGYREVRLLAATGPGAGVVEVRLGRRWHRVDLRRPTTTRRDQVRLRDASAPRLSGPIELRVVSPGKRARLDGLLAR